MLKNYIKSLIPDLNAQIRTNQSIRRQDHSKNGSIINQPQTRTAISQKRVRFCPAQIFLPPTPPHITMLATRSFVQRSFAATTRAMSTSSKKVAVLGASGGIGQPLSMLLKLSPHVGELSCYDIVGTPGVAADLSHVSVSCFVVPKIKELYTNRILSHAQAHDTLPSHYLPVG